MVVFIILMFVVQNVRGSAVMFLLLDGNDFTLMDYNGKMSKKKKLIVQVLCLLVYNMFASVGASSEVTDLGQFRHLGALATGLL